MTANANTKAVARRRISSIVGAVASLLVVCALVLVLTEDASFFLSQVTSRETESTHDVLRGGRESQATDLTILTLPSPCNLFINEIYYHPEDVRVEGEVGGKYVWEESGDWWEFVELYNILEQRPIDLSGASFSKGIKFTFPQGTYIRPQSTIIVARDPNRHAERCGFDVYGPYDGHLSNDGEKIELTAADGTVIDTVKYKDGGKMDSRFWPRGPDGFGYSLERRFYCDDRVPIADHHAWRPSAEKGGSPCQQWSVEEAEPLWPGNAEFQFSPRDPTSEDDVTVTVGFDLPPAGLHSVERCKLRYEVAGQEAPEVVSVHMEKHSTGWTAVIPALPSQTLVRVNIEVTSMSEMADTPPTTSTTILPHWTEPMAFASYFVYDGEIERALVREGNWYDPPPGLAEDDLDAFVLPLPVMWVFGESQQYTNLPNSGTNNDMATGVVILEWDWEDITDANQDKVPKMWLDNWEDDLSEDNDNFLPEEPEPPESDSDGSHQVPVLDEHTTKEELEEILDILHGGNGGHPRNLHGNEQLGEGGNAAGNAQPRRTGSQRYNRIPVARIEMYDGSKVTRKSGGGLKVSFEDRIPGRPGSSGKWRDMSAFNINPSVPHHEGSGGTNGPFVEEAALWVFNHANIDTPRAQFVHIISADTLFRPKVVVEQGLEWTWTRDRAMPFSVRWQTLMVAPYDGLFTIIVEYLGGRGFRVYLDENLIIDVWDPPRGQDKLTKMEQKSIELSRRQQYGLTIEYKSDFDLDPHEPSFINLKWILPYSAGGGMQSIPLEYLSPGAPCFRPPVDGRHHHPHIKTLGKQFGVSVKGPLMSDLGSGGLVKGVCATYFPNPNLSGGEQVRMGSEQIGKTFLSNHGWDKDGKLFKSWQNTYEQHTAKENLDLNPMTLVDRLQLLKEDVVASHTMQTSSSSSNWEVDVVGRLEGIIDLNNFVSYSAVSMLLCNWDGFFNNHWLYRGSFKTSSHSTPLWRIFPWDLDKTFGLNDQETVNNPWLSYRLHPYFDMPLSYPKDGLWPGVVTRPPGNVFELLHYHPAYIEKFKEKLKLFRFRFFPLDDELEKARSRGTAQNSFAEKLDDNEKALLRTAAFLLERDGDLMADDPEAENYVRIRNAYEGIRLFARERRDFILELMQT